ncbi:MAG: hypothetical protein WC052_01215 [Patescibacteria group bacterium]
MNIANFFSVSYLTTNFPGVLSRNGLIAWAVLAGVVLCAAVAGSVLIHRTTLLPAWRAWSRRWVILGYTVSGLAFLFLFLRYEQVPWFSARYWMLLLACVAAVWSMRLLYRAIRVVPKQAAAQAEDRRRRQYLP